METRFFNRKAHLIDYESFLEVMQEILDDSSLTIEKDYPRLSLYSAGYDSWTIVNKIDTKRERLRGKHLLKSQFFFVGRQVSI